MSIKLISTDFDGTIFAEFENPPIPQPLQDLLAALQQRGIKWAINTGRDMSSLMEALGRAGVKVEPDFLVLVEREIHLHENSSYHGLQEWNQRCTRDHDELFKLVRPDLPEIVDWINSRFHARIYEDPYSPFCLIAGNNGDADIIHDYLNAYCQCIPNLSVVRNDVYARFCHSAYNKGTALAELTRRLGLKPENVFVAGDHLNDLPMLDRQYAHTLAAPTNAIELVKSHVRERRGHVSESWAGWGTLEALQLYLMKKGGSSGA